MVYEGILYERGP